MDDAHQYRLLIYSDVNLKKKKKELSCQAQEFIRISLNKVAFCQIRLF